MADKTKNANTKGEEKTQRKSLVELALKNNLVDTLFYSENLIQSDCLRFKTLPQ